MDLFRVRLNCVDHYQAIPTEFDPELIKDNGQAQQNTTAKVPVIRVFGATETGQKVCAHIHGAFPYLYVEYNGSLVPDEVDVYVHRLHLSIDHALAVSYRRNTHDGKTAFVAHISLVKGIPFYGYHVGYRFFLKIYLLNPLHITRLADLLRQGTITNKAIQPYESHLQYLAQWMCDYNLFGCAYIDCSIVHFRSPVPEYSKLMNTAHKWHDHTVPPPMISEETKVPRQSHCSIEVDVRVEDIVNRREVKARPLHHDFAEPSKPQHAEEKFVHSMAGLWKDETRRRKARMGILDSGSSPFPPEVLISVSADSRNSQDGGWIHEQEFREKMLAIATDEREITDRQKVEFQTFVKPQTLESRVKTAFESVEELHSANISKLVASQKALQMIRKSLDTDSSNEIEVDESRILSFGHEDITYESDEDLARDLAISQRTEGDHLEISAATIDGPTMINDEAQPEKEQYQERFHDSLDLPGSSAELERQGVRNIGDYSHVDEDAFEIPLDCTSDIGSAIARHKRVKRRSNMAELPKKKRKIIPADSQPGPVGKSLRKRLFVDRPDWPHVGEFSAASNDPQEPVTLRSPSPCYRRLHPEPLRASSHSEGVDDDRGPSFPVVKDPQDFLKIGRLSQQSRGSLRSSQKINAHQLSINGERISQPLKNSISINTISPLSTSTTEDTSKIISASSRLHQAFDIHARVPIMCFSASPPSSTELVRDMIKHKIPSVIYDDAYYGNDQDVPDHGREYAGKDFKIEGKSVPYLPEFDPTGTSLASVGRRLPVAVDRIAEESMYRKDRQLCTLRTWEIEAMPPTRLEVQQWLAQGLPPINRAVSSRDLSQIEGATQKHKHGFKYSQNQTSANVQHETQYMSVMSLEIHVNTRGNLVPNPEQDEIACVFWCLQSEDEELEMNGENDGTHVGIVVLSDSGGLAHQISQQTSVEVEEESSELDLINKMVDIVRFHDPDVLTGFEVHGGSWGYLIERARLKYECNLCDGFSRMKSQSHGRFGRDNDRWGFNQTSTIRVTGRHMINIWRAMRSELNLLQYTMENIVFHLLHRRIPHYAFKDLTRWYNSNKPRDLGKLIAYFVSRVQLDLQILEQNELISRTSEQARLLGVDFFSVFSRGSQFKVESLMFRIAKAENFILVSPSRKQVGQQNALECLPLVMEPQSGFYSSPLLVLDFQSLYPSVMIAYNYCYSTFLGRVVHWRGQNKMGFRDFARETGLLELLKDHINIAPNGMMYARPEIRKSLLAKMLGEILETRVMVKSGMKEDKEDRTLQRLLNNRQLALKLIANVTYGYTSASFSGRMPCSEIADSIVQTGRETLEKAIALIHSVERWGAEIVYGDTDSLFVYLKGRTRDQAFDIGEEIAKAVTDMNPRPVKLKFEKVYHPCVLLAKKRYVGFKYESREQKQAVFDAKGIETVRRDGTPVEQKIEEKALKILFRTGDLSQVKSYFQRQCTKIMKGSVSIQDFCFAKEVKLGTYSDRALPPPGALISARRMLADPRAEPQYGERVPYVVVTGALGARLADRCVAPDVLLHNDHVELDAEYYITKNIIPPLERIFNLVGANVRQWYFEMPKFQRVRRIDGGGDWSKDPVAPTILESYMKSSACAVCRTKIASSDGRPICDACAGRPAASLLALRARLNRAEARALDLARVCRSCASLPFGDEVACDSKDCPVFYTRVRHVAGLRSARAAARGPAVAALEDAQAASLDW